MALDQDGGVTGTLLRANRDGPKCVLGQFLVLRVMAFAYGDQSLGARIPGEIGEPRAWQTRQPAYDRPVLAFQKCGFIDVLIGVVNEIKFVVRDQEFASAVFVDARSGRILGRKKLRNAALFSPSHHRRAAFLSGSALAPVDGPPRDLNFPETHCALGHRRGRDWRRPVSKRESFVFHAGITVSI